MPFTPIQAGDTGLSIREKLNSRLPMANVDVEAKAPVIDDGELVLDLGSESHTWHVVSLTESIDAGGISIVNLPDVDVIRVHLEFRRPSANAFDVPVTAFTGIAGSVVFDSDWHVYADDTPSVAVLLSTDGGATWRVQTNAPIVVQGSGVDSGLADLNGTIISEFRNSVGSASGALTTAAHSGRVLVTSGNVTIPNAGGDVGFTATLIAGGAHTVTFNSTVSAAMAAGDVMTVIVESTSVIHAVLTAAADKVAFT